MPQRRYETVIDSATSGTGSATFYAQDQTRFSLAMLTIDDGGTAVCEYKIALYPTPDTVDAAAVTYASTITAGAAAVALFDNLCDAQGQPFVFYKCKITWEDLANGALAAKIAAF